MNTTSYTIQTALQIFIGVFAPQVIFCPVCGLDSGLCLSTSGDGHPVTGSCPANHVWDERRVTGTEVKEKAIELAKGDR